jgi:hypothetical protein
MRRIVSGGRSALILAAVLLSSAPAFADYTVSGRFLYEDREFDENGFTGNITRRPIRHADVRIMAGILLLKTGATQEDGTFTITVAGTPDQAVTAVCVTTSAATPGLLLDARVANNDFSFGDFYSIATPPTPVTSQNAIDVGTTLAPADSDTGKIFNIWDVLIDGMQFVASDQAAGSLPSVKLTVLWRLTHPRTGSFYMSGGSSFMYVGSTSAYDDTDRKSVV